MATNYRQPGEVILHTAGANIASGRVVRVGKILGVALKDIASGATGEVQISGVFEVTKVSGAVINAGENLVFDQSANGGLGAFDDNAATPATGDVSGGAAVAWEAAGDGVTSMLVKFTGVPGTVA
jgi:predicted RecA/RadA family phage recombinase